MGLAENVSQTDLETFADILNAASQCPLQSITTQDFVITSFVLHRVGGGHVSHVDAVAFGFGQNAFPTGSTPPP